MNQKIPGLRHFRAPEAPLGREELRSGAQERGLQPGTLEAGLRGTGGVGDTAPTSPIMPILRRGQGGLFASSGRWL